jgi:hypothetical protein
MELTGSNTHPNLRLPLLQLLLFLSASCATPVGVTRVDPRIVHQQLTSNVLSRGVTSGPAEIVLHQHDLSEQFRKQPETALAELHQIILSGRGGADEIFALTKLSFLHAENTGKRLTIWRVLYIPGPFSFLMG